MKLTTLPAILWFGSKTENTWSLVSNSLLIDLVGVLVVPVLVLVVHVLALVVTGVKQRQLLVTRLKSGLGTGV